MPNNSDWGGWARISAIGIFAFIAILGFWGFPSATYKAHASAFGPAPSFTNAPGESNCTACHSTFPVNSGEGGITISGMPANYLPGQQIPLTVTVSDNNGVNFGFEGTAVDSVGQKAGDLVLPSTTPEPMLLQYGNVGGDLREYISHTVDGIVPTVAGTKSWQFTWTAPARRVGKVGFYAAGNAADGTGGTESDYIYTTSASTLSGTNLSSFDGDQRSEPAVFRPSDGGWYSLNSTDGQFQVAQWGLSEDVPVPGDYDGDGITDRAVFRPSAGFWYLLKSTEGVEWIPWGVAGDIPVAGDYDGDLKTDVAVFRPSTGYWYIRKSSGGFDFIYWGASTDICVPGDYDGDARTDTAVYRPGDGTWYIKQSSDGNSFRSWGVASDVPVQGDYDGDGRYDIAVYRPSEGVWYINGSRIGISARPWGVSTDIPVPADYDGDGSTDVGVFRGSEGVWYAVNSSDNTFFIRSWGAANDIPIPNAYLP